MAFHEVRFPDDIAYGATGGPEYLTSVVSMASGYEQRNANWSAARGKWNVAPGLKHQAALASKNLAGQFTAISLRQHRRRFVEALWKQEASKRCVMLTTRHSLQKAFEVN